MANQWFKFYGGEYLCDPKIKSLTALERSCWLTILCYASVAEVDGIIKHLTEKQLIFDSGGDPFQSKIEETEGILKKFQDLQMIQIDNGIITVINWNKKQEKNLTPYERVKKYRMIHGDEMKQKETDVTNDNANDNARIEENRIEKNRRDIYTPDFISFWNLYPKKVGKPKAYLVWKKIKKENREKILKDIPLRKEDDKWVNGYIKDPERYLKSEQWEDQIIKSKTNSTF